MKRMLAAALGLFALSGAAYADEFFAGDLEATRSYQLGVQTHATRATPGAAYSNIDNFTGQGFANGGAALQSGNTITTLVADDLTPVTGIPSGTSITQFSFTVVNFDTTSTTFRPRVRFWFADGAGGLPGNYYNLPGGVDVGFSFAPITQAAGTAITYTGTVTPGTFDMPTSTFWAGITFDNNGGTTGANAAKLNLLGVGIFSPPVVGSSLDAAFQTTGAGSFFTTDNPAGSAFNFGGAPAANFGWEFVPEPSSLSLLALGCFAIRRRR